LKYRNEAAVDVEITRTMLQVTIGELIEWLRSRQDLAKCRSDLQEADTALFLHKPGSPGPVIERLRENETIGHYLEKIRFAEYMEICHQDVLNERMEQ